MSGSKMFAMARCFKDSICYEYENVKVTTYLNGSGLKDIKVITADKHIHYIKNDGITYFYGIVDNKIVIDCGTSNIRDFSIYDLKDMSLIFTSSYKNNINADRKDIFFIYPIGPKDKYKLPECLQKEEWEKLGGSAGYVINRAFNLTTRKLTDVGSVKCEYFE